MTKQELGQKIKSKYPQYQGIDDTVLADKIIEKYPVYSQQITDISSVAKMTTENKKSGLLSQIGQSISGTAGEIKESLQKSATGKITPVQGATRVVGDVIGGGGDILFNVIKEGVKSVSPKTVEGIKGAVSKVAETELVKNISSAYNDWATKNPEAAKDLGSILNVASILPIGGAGAKAVKTGIKATEEGIETAARGIGKATQVIGTAGEKTGKALVSAAIPPKEQAARVLSYKAATPLKSRFKQAMEGVEKSPITPADVVIKYNLPTVSRSGIGIKAKRVANDLFENQVKPTLKGIKERVSKNEIFDGIQKTINNTKDISRRKSLQKAFNALSEDYKNVSSWSVKTLDEIKSGLSQRLPSKIWKGEDIAGDMNNVRKMFADKARDAVRSRLPKNVIDIYDDYGALKDVSKMGIKALQSGINTNMIGLAGEVFRTATTPLATGIGTGISKAGTALRKLGTKLKSKKVNLKNIKPGLTIEDVSKKPLPKGKGEILKTTQKNKPETVKVWVKSKFSDSGSYTEFPIIRKVDNKTLYQGSKPGESRQFWTPNKKYAQQFGDVKEKTGSFYQVDNGNRMTDVFVEVKSKSTPKTPLVSKAEQSLIKEAKKIMEKEGRPHRFDLSDDEFLKKVFITKEEAAKNIVDAYKKKNSQMLTNRVRDAHSAPGIDDYTIKDVISGKSNQPKDILTLDGLKKYGNESFYGKETINAINQAQKTGKIKIYRAVPKNVNKIEGDDWVYLVKEQATTHGKNRLEGDYKILSKEVNIDDIRWDGNDIREWGYAPKSTPLKSLDDNLIQEAKKYKSADEFIKAQGTPVYHQSQSKTPFTEFKQKGDTGYRKASYSQANEGIYFSPNKDLVKSKYGQDGGILVESVLQPKKKLDLGSFDAMYFDGRKVSYGDIVTENFRRELKGLKPLPEPDIILTGISKKAKNWLEKNGYDLVEGMKGEMYSAPELVVLDKSIIKTKSQLTDIWNKANK